MVCGYFRENIPCELLGICALVHVNNNISYEVSPISVDHARYATSIVEKYLDTAIFNTGKKFYNTTLPSDMILTKAEISTSDEKNQKLTREFNINYRACIGSFIYLLSTKVELSFVVHTLAKFSENPGKVRFEELLHILRYIRDNKTLGLKYYANINHAPVSNLLRQATLKLRIT